MNLDRMLEMSPEFLSVSKPHGRCSNLEWAACLSLGYA